MSLRIVSLRRVFFRRISSSVDARFRTGDELQKELQIIPDWLRLELRTDHAGEYGAVQIYNGAYYGLKLHEVTNIWIDSQPVKEALSFCERHKKAEAQHLTLLEDVVKRNDRTSLIPVWHLAGFALGFFPSIFGSRSLYWTIAAVETFVEEHYKHQINRISDEGDQYPHLRKLLEICCEDEVHHKEEAVAALLGSTKSSTDSSGYSNDSSRHPFVKIWTLIVDKGSRLAVKLSKIL